MGVETVVTCDECGKNLKGVDYATIEINLEVDRNYGDGTDVKKRKFAVYCELHGSQKWELLQLQMKLS